MSVDWVMRIDFNIIYYDENGRTQEGYVCGSIHTYDLNLSSDSKYSNFRKRSPLIPQSYYINNEIWMWEQLNPITTLYENGKWNIDDDVTFETKDFKYISYSKRDVVNEILGGMFDIKKMLEILAVPVGDRSGEWTERKTLMNFGKYYLG